jgi:exopolysaccharide/PEP-CTERM locus tyrosine autokinase
MRLAAEGFLDQNNTKSQLAEEFRVIKRPLVNNIQDAAINGIQRSNLILICSSLPGEGKTFVSINLALSIANELDKKVLLIDADVEKPSISKQFGIKTSTGLIEYLENDKITFSDILLKTDLPNLSLIPAGKKHKYSTELLSSQRMYLFADEVSRRYSDRVVIFDSPPLLVATQAQVLAELVGQVVLVIGAEETPQSVVNDSIAKLANCDVVMTLLNKTKKELDLYGYNYGYGKYGHP